MAVIAPVVVSYNGEGHAFKWSAITPGDTCSPLTVVAGQDQITILMEGTIGTATVRIRGKIPGTTIDGIVDDAYGSALSTAAAFNANAFIKPMGPNVTEFLPEIVGGSGSNVDVTAFIVSKPRP